MAQSSSLPAAKYEAVIGLEVHAQLLTKSKIFCGDSTEFGMPPNTNISPVSLGHPGVLPVLNKQAVEFAIKMGVATHCQIRPVSLFARKHYFYPDLPKGYQISQFDEPLCYEGWIDIEEDPKVENTATKRIGITRIHMEEDAGKSIHDLDIDTLVDLNRAGVALIEIVSEPDLRSAQDSVAYLTQIRQILLYLGICDGNMEEGSMRCDANISIRPIGQEEFGTKTEVKNMNSFRNVEKAIEYEIARQIELVEAGGTVVQETRGWDAASQTTKSQRSKEQAHDYRYFPEPDLPPLRVSKDWLASIQSAMPELALDRKHRFVREFGLPGYDAHVLTQERAVAQFFEDACSHLSEKTKDRTKLVSNWIMTEVMRTLGEKKITIQELNLSPQHVAELVELFASDAISSKIAKEIFPDVLQGKSPKKVVEEKGLAQVSDTSLIVEIVDRILAGNPDEVSRYRGGKTNVMGFFVGQALKETKGKANPKVVTQILQERLDG
ncbi:MAG: Asp-tRNA(Asn)/Glu-tRNA(Gln) amidotransferase subunit GatB [Candidatus Kapaibacterium sp.]|nr:MAG: Asp-tRNA(Asn)/Glu-tRNA(Gln) amidotransferase subunit GatB [Candidatus Kapabacteria bacterium]